MSSKTAIVIVGGGGAGVDLARALDKELDPTKHALTLITAADYFRHLPATLRAIVTAEGSLEDQICISYDKIYGKNTSKGTGRVGTIQFGKVVAIEEKIEDTGYVVLEGNKRVEWNILVIASGSEWNGPLRWPTNRSLVRQYVDEWREKFASARNIALVGGGAVGVELAGELRDFVPGAQVTIVHRDSLALNDAYPNSFRRRVQTGLEVRGVKVLTDDSVNNLEQAVLDGTQGLIPGRTITTEKGVVVAADLIVPTGGSRRVYTTFLGVNSPSALTINAAVDLKTNPNVFVAGDVVALKEQHSLIKAGAHASIIAANILSLIQAQGSGAKEVGALKLYQKATDSVAVTNGASRGSTYMDFFTTPFFGWPIILGNWITSLLKSKTLLVGPVKSRLNQ